MTKKDERDDERTGRKELLFWFLGGQLAVVSIGAGVWKATDVLATADLVTIVRVSMFCSAIALFAALVDVALVIGLHVRGKRWKEDTEDLVMDAVELLPNAVIDAAGQAFGGAPNAIGRFVARGADELSAKVFDKKENGTAPAETAQVTVVEKK